MKRVQIIGYSGSGKTTFAKELAKKLGCEHVELDGLFWLENWQEKPTEEFKREVEIALQPSSWVIDGDYMNRLDGYTLKLADTVVILRYPASIFLKRLFKRGMRRAFTREKIWGNNQETLVGQLGLLKLTFTKFVKGGRDRYVKKLKKRDFVGEVIMLNNPNEAKKWLETL